MLTDIINRIENGYLKEIFVSNGWGDLVYGLHEKLVYISPNYKVYEVKQKFGGLRYYAKYVPKGKEKNPDLMQSIFDDLIALAETSSYNICETCGEFGKLTGTTYLYVACKDHIDNIPPGIIGPKAK